MFILVILLPTSISTKHLEHAFCHILTSTTILTKYIFESNQPQQKIIFLNLPLANYNHKSCHKNKNSLNLLLILDNM